MYIPADTRMSAASLFHASACSASPRKIAERSTPKSGVRKLKIDTVLTGLYFIRIPHTEYATAEMSAM